MSDYEYLFSTSLHQKLKSKIVGKIHCKVVPELDWLVVRIDSFGDLHFETRFQNFSHKLINGFSTEQAAYEIEWQYKRTVLDRYFIG